MEDASAWNSNAEACSQSAGMTIKYGIDALEMGGVSPGDKMLDVASGPGHLAAYAASEKGATVDAIDFASENIATLQRNLQSNPVAVTGHVMDGQQLEFQDDLFDVSCSCFGVFLFPDYVKGLSEMFRVTKPGGRAVVVSWAEPHRAAMQVWARLFDQQFPEVLPLPLPAGIEKMSTMEGAKEVLAAAGFENVKVSEVVHTWEVPDPTAFTNMFMQNPLMQLVRARLNTERFAELVPRVLELLESDYKKGDRISFDAVGIIACGTKPMP
eukprot:jgi/Ulvmu1/3852/UM018_0071.1